MAPWGALGILGHPLRDLVARPWESLVDHWEVPGSSWGPAGEARAGRKLAETNPAFEAYSLPSFWASWGALGGPRVLPGTLGTPLGVPGCLLGSLLEAFGLLPGDGQVCQKKLNVVKIGLLNLKLPGPDLLSLNLMKLYFLNILGCPLGSSVAPWELPESS